MTPVLAGQADRSDVPPVPRRRSRNYPNGVKLDKQGWDSKDPELLPCSKRAIHKLLGSKSSKSVNKNHEEHDSTHTYEMLNKHNVDTNDFILVTRENERWYGMHDGGRNSEAGRVGKESKQSKGIEGEMRGEERKRKERKDVKVGGGRGRGRRERRERM
jgi:hypothetical protein